MLNQIVFVGRVTVISDIGNYFRVKNDEKTFYFLTNKKTIQIMKDLDIVGCIVGIKGHLEIQGDIQVAIADKVSFLQSTK